MFCPYEDAIMGRGWAMSHSLLSVPLNLGVLHPLNAVHAAERAYRKSAPLSPVEGLIRQILGWREYMWHLYWHFGPAYTRNNKLEARTKLPGLHQPNERPLRRLRLRPEESARRRRLPVHCRLLGLRAPPP